MEDSSSPYYMQSSDQPGITIVQDPLTGPTYASWSKAIIMALKVKIKLNSLMVQLRLHLRKNPLNCFLRGNVLIVSFWDGISILVQLRFVLAPCVLLWRMNCGLI